ncbi:MAG: transcription-repair coupling factor, partial [Gammaproteobacteria bacterium]
RDVSQGLSPGGIEYYIPLFFAETASLFDYVPDTATVVLAGDTSTAIASNWQEILDRYEQRRHDLERPILAPDRLFLDPDTVATGLAGRHTIALQNHELPDAQNDSGMNFGSRLPPSLLIDSRADEPAAALTGFIDSFDGRVLMAAESAGRREYLLELLRGHDLETRQASGWQTFLGDHQDLAITVAALEEGLLLPDAGLAIIAESQLFGERVQTRRRRRAARDPATLIRDLTDLNPGAPVVHEEHGVGRYLGLQTLEAGGVTTEFLTLEYAAGDKLYVPVSSLHLISRYTGASPEHAPLHRLGSDQWEKAKRRAAEKARDVAAELLEIYARRAARSGHAFRLDERTQRAFAEAFPFEETPDQQTAIESVLDDMTRRVPMDRVVCGDVGFGKTEVAMRAAFAAVNDGRQVAMLVPTTLLGQQHYQTLRDRFADWPVRVELISRFRSQRQHSAILADLEAGKVDILVGTHKLLSDDVKFKDLGLVIIDEEHRFGVRHKEKLKSLRAEVDVLTLTATPIPRTLNMSLAGIRDLSIIATPPAERLSVKTFVSEWNDSLIREACLREIKRGGQVYFLHNSVETMEKMTARLQQLLPEASIRHAHGQMREKELEQVMLDFYHRRFNILVCSTIVESGIDVPTANTIIINRADKFGLAQLHQLRGRVGRSHHRAYAYLIAPPQNVLTADARKRLEAIESLEDLGAGFTLATHDLEIRGAGELLGDEQSGQIHEVGFSLYTDLLERAVKALKSGRMPELDRPLEHGPEVDLRLPALLPDDYVPDVHQRLILYKRIASAENDEALRELQVEMIDRFGLLPDAAKMLFRLAEIKLRAAALGITRIEAGNRGGRFQFVSEPPIDPMTVIRLVQAEPDVYRLEGSRLRFQMVLEDREQRIKAVTDLLDTLQEGQSSVARSA